MRLFRLIAGCSHQLGIFIITCKRRSALLLLECRLAHSLINPSTLQSCSPVQGTIHFFLVPCPRNGTAVLKTALFALLRLIFLLTVIISTIPQVEYILQKHKKRDVYLVYFSKLNSTQHTTENIKFRTVSELCKTNVVDGTKPFTCVGFQSSSACRHIPSGRVVFIKTLKMWRKNFFRVFRALRPSLGFSLMTIIRCDEHTGQRSRGNREQRGCSSWGSRGGGRGERG